MAVSWAFLEGAKDVAGKRNLLPGAGSLTLEKKGTGSLTLVTIMKYILGCLRKIYLLVLCEEKYI